MMKLEFGPMTEQRAVAGEKNNPKMIGGISVKANVLNGQEEAREPGTGLEPDLALGQSPQSRLDTDAIQSDDQAKTEIGKLSQADKIIPITLFPLNNFWSDEGAQLDAIEAMLSEED